ncbi:MAG: helix-turn-helix domain-containing protein [Thermaurantiacus sp.]
MTAPPSFSLRYFAPAAPLRSWVSSYYLFETSALRISDTLRAELPQVRFLIRGRGTFAFGDTAPVPVPLAGLCGPTDVAMHFEAEGPIRLFGAGLLPAGWAALVGAGANEFADQVVDLVSVAGQAALRCWMQMAEATRARDIVGAADAFFLLLSAQAKPPPLWFTRAADSWLADSVNPSVDDLVGAINMSARQVERLCQRIYGAPPKMLARKYRALQAAVRFGLDPEAGWEAAAAGAFYDQSHFIREFKTFVGMTPSQFVAHGSPWITRLTIAKRQALVTLPRLTKVS